uniref:Nucleosome assembly protein n=1 Tax=Chromera velia CCMP2878 TaxID=1169474 RepID=A0A0G4ICQ8_9ALVE|eukprot:Cvel_13221.t1-p1 / transcript=Cvel_13221.t1 / gene=Cvel_13221 / organism=Chromera_velia_CCMP2878 / gene_product=Nucleosome assembly protein 1-like 1, putative / transcript_product=Nucleosome assembly protein 1-like 1, putative / location=Cvel_scaffold895:11393-22137(+) / protein_length=371 / sequence_SO=supercontig / SO=protein_coding / is_pseudo=false
MSCVCVGLEARTHNFVCERMKPEEKEGSDTEGVTDQMGALKIGGDEAEEELTEPQKATLDSLKKLDEERNTLHSQYTQEWNALKAKYQLLYNPLFSKRAEVLQIGASEGETTGTPALPKFWLKALKNHSQIADMIEPHDENVLSYLKDVRFEWEDDKEQRSFSLFFEFAENPYFTPLLLTKKYKVEADEQDPSSSADVLSSTESTELQWLPGKDVTKKTITKKQKNKRTKATRKITETVDCPSFFNFFRSHEIPDEEKLEKMDEEQLEELEVVVEADYQAGCIIREKIIPLAVNWFTGEAVDSDVDDDSDDFDLHGDDDDDEDDEDDEDESPSPKKGKKGMKGDAGGKGGKGGPGGPGGKGGDNKEECKTQ